MGTTTSARACMTTTGKVTATTTTDPAIRYLKVDLTMGLLANMEAVRKAETSDLALASFLAQRDIGPNIARRATSFKHPRLFPPGNV